MTDDDKRELEEFENLRRRAERILRRLAPDQDTATLTAEQLRAIVHELQVSQTELEIQNEELRRAQQRVVRSKRQVR